MAKLDNIWQTDTYSQNLVKINNCAVVQLSDTDHYTNRKNGRTDYLLMFISKGTCYATVGGKEYTVRKNEAFLYHPNEPQFYHFYKKDNTIDYWVHFGGTQMQKIIESLGLEGKHHLKMNYDTFDIEQTLSRICREFNAKNTYYEQICSGLLISVLAVISRSVLEKSIQKKPVNFIEHILGEFHSSPSRHFVIKDLALEHNITENHLIKSFKKSTGMTPSQYMIDFRIKKTKELLLYSDYSISQISELLGYQDPAYFSRLFKKHTGISPNCFRLNKKNEPEKSSSKTIF